MRNNKGFILMVFGIAGLLSCLSSPVKNVPKDRLHINNFTVDKLGFYYETDNLDRIRKFDKDNKLLYSYSNHSFGSIGTIDVSNPHKILVFYFDQQILLLLDNTLSELSKIELDPSSTYVAAGMSNDANIWLFDSDKRNLIKIDKNGNNIDESFPLNELNSESISGHKIIENDNYVMIPVDNKIIYLYNNQGFFIRKIILDECINPTIISDKIYYFDKKNNNYSAFDLKYNQKSVLYDFSVDKIKPAQVIFSNDQFYILENNSVRIKPLRNEPGY
ncbi:MAG TPA: hypothetical protein ENK91_09770 [Bacteroidetes bacterium]|nr:hypothetical protein [Bacteroidota bacterium]